MRLRILLADAHKEVRAALFLLLGEERGYSVIGEASDVGGLLRLAEEMQPDVVLLDWELPGDCVKSSGFEGISVLDHLRKVIPRADVIAMSVRPEQSERATSAGATAFVSKGEPAECLLKVLGDLAARRGGRGDSEAGEDRPR